MVKIRKMRWKTKRYPTVEAAPMKKYRFAMSMNIVTGEKGYRDLYPTRLKGVFKCYEVNRYDEEKDFMETYSDGCSVVLDSYYKFVTVEALAEMEHWELVLECLEKAVEL